MKPLSHELITELHDLIKDKLGLDLSYEETAKTGEAWVRYFDLLITMDRENKSAKLKESNDVAK